MEKVALAQTGLKGIAVGANIGAAAVYCASPWIAQSILNQLQLRPDLAIRSAVAAAASNVFFAALEGAKWSLAIEGVKILRCRFNAFPFAPFL